MIEIIARRKVATLIFFLVLSCVFIATAVMCYIWASSLFKGGMNSESMYGAVSVMFAVIIGCGVVVYGILAALFITLGIIKLVRGVIKVSESEIILGRRAIPFCDVHNIYGKGDKVCVQTKSGETYNVSSMAHTEIIARKLWHRLNAYYQRLGAEFQNPPVNQFTNF